MTKWTSREVKKLKENPNDLPWDDLRVPISSVRVSGSKPPTQREYKGGAVLGFSTSSDQQVFFIVQLPHSWAEETPINAHIHWTIPTSGSGGGAETVTWVFTHSWANIDDVLPAETTSTVTKDVQDITAATHMLTDIVEIEAKGKRVSSCLLCSLMRDVSEDNYGYEAYLMEIDFHFQSDSNGSYFQSHKLTDDRAKQKGNPDTKFKSGAW